MNYNSGADFKRYRYRYDNPGRLLAVDTYEGPETTDDPSYYETFTDYSYNPNSTVETQNFLTGFTGTSLGYDNRGRIISYYSHNSEFIFNLSYLRNSNVLQQELYGSYRDYFANMEDLVYKFTYDKSNRLLSATNTAGSSNEYAVENTYDKDGNILTLKRYGDAGVMQDDFAYQYYSGTNKLRKVTGSADQYQYDLNGNVTTDSLNKNSSAVYDHRNLLTEIYHRKGSPPARVDYYATRYYYDEAGNRIRKLTYKNNDANAGPVLDWNNTSNPGNSWTLFNNEHYARGVDGKELATYINNSLDEWYVWGTDMTGKIKGSTKYYFFKDHLGSVRAVVDNNFNLISATDYDAWGDKMQGRIYNGDSTKFGFTGKEEDEENLYVYFGARYYDSRIGRWGQVEPLLEKYPGTSPYVYSLNNPLNIDDPTGKDPRRNQMANLNEVTNLLQSYEGSTIESFIFNALRGDESPRYVYGENGGFIDLVHFFAAADVTTKLDITLPKSIAYYMGRTLGDYVEFFQTLKLDDSMFDPEDLPSNDQGAEFGLTLDLSESFLINEDLIKKFESFMLNEVKIIDKDDPSIARDKVRIRENKDDNPLMQRFERTPYRGD